MKILGIEFGRSKTAEAVADVVNAAGDNLGDIPMPGAIADTTGSGTPELFDGSKYLGGFGSTKIFSMDYWSLRHRSVQLFTENLYARGLIRRLLTNEINVGLTLEATPIGEMLGIDDDALNDWTEDTENRFSVWAKNPRLCDYHGQRTFGQLQRLARMTALLSGDVLIVLRVSKQTRLPQVQIIDGRHVQTPMKTKPLKSGHEIRHGIEFDAQGRQVAFWVRQENALESKRVAARGEKSGRRLAWMMYGTERRADDVRGMPLLGIILQSLKELDRYRDAELRAATLNATVAMTVEKDQDKPGTRPLSGGAVVNSQVSVVDNRTGATTGRSFQLSDQLPGTVYDELQYGEKIKSFDTSRPNVNYGAFESSVIHAMAWACEMPPEVLELSFSSNYSASRGAVNEFKMYLNRTRADLGDGLCEPVYQEWLLAEVLMRKIEAPGLIEAWRDPMKYDTFGAWVASDWGGAIKPSVDLKKEVAGYADLIKEGLITRERAAKELTGMKYSKVVKRLKRENDELAEANESRLEWQELEDTEPSLIDEEENGSGLHAV